MEALKAIKIIGNQNDGRTVFLCLPNTGLQRVLNFMRDPKLAHILVRAIRRFVHTAHYLGNARVNCNITAMIVYWYVKTIRLMI